MALVRPTYGLITLRMILCDRSRLPFYRQFAHISWAHVPGPARNRVKRFYRSAGPRVGVDNEYASMLTSSMMGSNRSSNGTNPTLNSRSHARNATWISKLLPGAGRCLQVC
ncbi:hypothetical protein CY34DRAFT_810904 [Suillus luteus UH-Slu-Lm8-n1]|uniref:Uncharacterized protein n=1 Tax=Suillus luteus UH-Slu-Lm8-n1 TaxID=930992 RepID=A0A0D0AFF3_9AGAM|nr:hypothetical protein CY34DRAFT_810904 [Suillus luteus UH-Slu-Lm8-n1]